MPTYEYRCENGHTFEEFQSIVSPPLDVCPVCGAKAERLISAGSGLIFKGSGFYITDYKHNNASTSGGRKKSSAELSSEKADKPDKTASAPKSDSTSKTETKSGS